MSTPPPRPRASASTIDYSSKGYWISRFNHEQNFEWLVSSPSLLPHITRALDDLDTKPLRILHIGCGNSELSLDLRQLVEGRPTASNINIVNVDYAPPALEQMRAAELARFGNITMQWEVLDLLDWGSMSQFNPERTVIIDKSCADAIACGQNIRTPLLAGGTEGVHPVEVLALYLAALVMPGSVWLAVSYSSGRFDFLASQDKRGPQTCNFWQLEYAERTLARTETKENVHAPEVYHTIFVLRRTAQKL
ncbi:hypothetical protein FS749_002081 [Ceratobasidium sp. UAMH 11750]|nr:hypothetical protein FS749_002081 [Ceratobasidium sp. UAMH 11750]